MNQADVLGFAKFVPACLKCSELSSSTGFVTGTASKERKVYAGHRPHALRTGPGCEMQYCVSRMIAHPVVTSLWVHLKGMAMKLASNIMARGGPAPVSRSQADQPNSLAEYPQEALKLGVDALNTTLGMLTARIAFPFIPFCDDV
eukprot:664252-Pelagomonas_calceolata.AAC.5